MIFGASLHSPTRMARAAALLALCLALPFTAWATPEDEIVPAGVLFVQAGLLLETQDSAFDRGAKGGPLKNNLFPDPAVLSQVSGEIEREILRYDLRFTYGISDSWNISLNIPFLDMEQRSTLATASTDPAVLAAVANLQTDAISGVGEVELTSLHRPVFSDWNALVWGYGYFTPGTGQQSPFIDGTTFDLGTPLPGIFVLVHYTRFPAISRSRFDARAVARSGISDFVTTPAGTQKLVPGNQLRFNMGWSQEFGPVAAGVEAEIVNNRQNTLGGQRLNDPVRAQILRLHLGYGNLAELETGPVGFPFQFRIELQDVQRGSNISDGSKIALSLLMYF